MGHFTYTYDRAETLFASLLGHAVFGWTNAADIPDAVREALARRICPWLGDAADRERIASAEKVRWRKAWEAQRRAIREEGEADADYRRAIRSAVGAGDDESIIDACNRTRENAANYHAALGTCADLRVRATNAETARDEALATFGEGLERERTNYRASLDGLRVELTRTRDERDAARRDAERLAGEVERAGQDAAAAATKAHAWRFDAERLAGGVTMALAQLAGAAEGRGCGHCQAALGVLRSVMADPDAAEAEELPGVDGTTERCDKCGRPWSAHKMALPPVVLACPGPEAEEGPPSDWQVPPPSCVATCAGAEACARGEEIAGLRYMLRRVRSLIPLIADAAREAGAVNAQAMGADEDIDKERALDELMMEAGVEVDRA